MSGSSYRSRPSRTSSTIAAAVSCLVTEASRKSVRASIASARAQVADAVRLLEDGAAAAAHEHGESRLVRGDQILEDRRGLRACGGLWSRREEQQQREHER